MPRLVLPGCPVDTSVGPGLRCCPPDTLSTQFVHARGFGSRPKGRSGEPKGTEPKGHGQGRPNLVAERKRQGWDSSADVHRPRLTRNGSFSVKLVFFQRAPSRSAQERVTSRSSLSRERAAISRVSSAFVAFDSPSTPPSRCWFCRSR